MHDVIVKPRHTYTTLLLTSKHSYIIPTLLSSGLLGPRASQYEYMPSSEDKTMVEFRSSCVYAKCF